MLQECLVLSTSKDLQLQAESIIKTNTKVDSYLLSTYLSLKLVTSSNSATRNSLL